MAPESLAGNAAPARRISVVVRVWTKTDEIFRLLDALNTQDCVPAEIVLIDSGSADWVCTKMR